MPFSLSLPESLRSARWKVKIREKETREPPHVTILRGTVAWRIDLRTKSFMDRVPDPSEVPPALLEYITKTANWNVLCGAWDRMYPANPVASPDEGEGEIANDNEG